MSESERDIAAPISSELESRADRAREWLLLDGNRLVVAFLTAAALLTLFGLSTSLGLLPLEQSQPAFYVFSALIGGNMTLITVVVSINQLLLSRELKSPGELESQIENVIDYRQEVEDAAGEIAPVEPHGFLKLLFQNTRQEAQRLGGLAAQSDDAWDEVNDLVTTLTDHVDEITRILEESDADVFQVLSVTLTTNYANQINQARRIRHRRSDELSELTLDCLGRLIDRLQEIDVARQYFKSVYLQDELSSLSRVLLYAGIPAEAFSVVVLLSFTGSGTTVLAANRVVLLPLSILFSFILRTATVTERTAATLPVTTPEQER
ncbi:hypothetical protein [Halomicrococcus sp. NG-SE-24]|uniref:hypothetical protein n=1 Tax=Halomicrococcus sp. NG-SE-24 TaxID=3436928 RepID=UPI003D99D42E